MISTVVIVASSSHHKGRWGQERAGQGQDKHNNNDNVTIAVMWLSHHHCHCEQATWEWRQGNVGAGKGRQGQGEGGDRDDHNGCGDGKMSMYVCYIIMAIVIMSQWLGGKGGVKGKSWSWQGRWWSKVMTMITWKPTIAVMLTAGVCMNLWELLCTSSQLNQAWRLSIHEQAACQPQDEVQQWSWFGIYHIWNAIRILN